MGGLFTFAARLEELCLPNRKGVGPLLEWTFSSQRQQDDKRPGLLGKDAVRGRMNS